MYSQYSELCTVSLLKCTVSILNCVQSVSPLNSVQPVRPLNCVQPVSPLGSSLLYGHLLQRCKNPGRQIARATIFCTLAPNICTDSLWILSHVTLLAYRILSLVLRFWKICGPLNYTRQPGTAGLIILVFQDDLSVCSVTSTLAFVGGCCWPPLRHRCTLPTAMAVCSHAVPALLWSQLPAEQLGAKRLRSCTAGTKQSDVME